MSVPEIDVHELERRLVAGAVLVDVREPDEYARGHVPGASLVPLSTIADRLDELAAREGEEVLVVCQLGGRSMKAAELLVARGVHAVNVSGGTQAWIDAGKPTEVGEGA